MRTRTNYNLSQWGKDVRKAVIDRDMTVSQLAEKIGYSQTTVSAVISGRYSTASYQTVAEKINKFLGTKGLPERVGLPSDEWCQCVRIELVKRKMGIGQLAKELNVSRDHMSMVINGRMMNKETVNAINKFLNIKMQAVSSGDN